MRTKKSGDYKYPPEKTKEWNDRHKAKLTPEQIQKNKDYSKEYNKKYRERQKELNIKKKSNCHPLPEKKVCSRCKIEKVKDDFRIRVDKRTEPPFEYLNSVCKVCDGELAAINYNKKKDDPAFKKKRNDGVKKYALLNKEKISASEKKRRQTPEYKKWVKDYYEKNREHILELHRNVCKRAVVELRDWVIVKRYSQNKNKDLRPILKENKELIEVMRLQTKLKKEIRKKKNGL